MQRAYCAYRNPIKRLQTELASIESNERPQAQPELQQASHLSSDASLKYSRFTKKIPRKIRDSRASPAMFLASKTKLSRFS